jgi:sugar O-acyltransferase (sialic acid O-acetyltransferase NeuD family)
MKPSHTLLIYGAGGHGLVVADAAFAAGQVVYALFDDQPQKWGLVFTDVPVQAYDLNYFPNVPLVLALGDNALRQRMASLVGHPFGCVIHPSASIAREVQLSAGSQVLAQAVLNYGAQIGRHTIVNTGVIVEHHVQVADFVHLAPGAILCGACSVGAGTTVGPGAVVVKGKKVGTGCVVAAGAVVVDDVPDGMRVQGVPGKASPLIDVSWDWS